MDNTEQVKSNNPLRCSVCYEEVDIGVKGSIKWNQDRKEGYGICSTCVFKYREKKPNTNKIHKDSYNYISTTVRQILNRHGFKSEEHTEGSLRNDTYVLWYLRGTSPNGYSLKVRVEVKKMGVADYKYDWSIRLYNKEGHFMRDAISESPNVPLIKDFLNKFMKEVGQDPYAYFLSNVRQLMTKTKILVRETKELEDRVEYYMGFKNGFNGKIVIDKDCKWHIQVYKSTGSLYREHKGKSFALPPLKEFFINMGREMGENEGNADP